MDAFTREHKEAVKLANEYHQFVIAMVHTAMGHRLVRPPFHSAHEGWAVLTDAMNELDGVVLKGKRDRTFRRRLRSKAIGVATMAMLLALEP